MPEEQRRLAAIMFTDIVGYSGLTQANEADALRLLSEHQALVRPIFSAHGGREIKSMADGFLIEFSSAVEALRAAIQIQESIPSSEPQIRIGIHLGDVVFRDGDVLGDGVNVASRIEQICQPGSICISEDIARQVRNKVDVELRSLGQPKLKNISTPLEVFEVIRKGSGGRSAAAPVSSQPSIAVLPFVNMSTDVENEFFSDGLTEEILMQVSQIRALKVISRTSVMLYKGSTKNLRAIAEELGVRTILEGSVRKAGDRVRITAQLIDAATDAHLWAQTYDRQISDIFAVQSDVAEQIADALKARVTPSENERIRRKPTENMDAFQAYLRGRVNLGKRVEERLRDAIRDFEEAISLDASYAPAYAGLADAYIFMSLLEYLPPSEAFPKARSAAEKAIGLDPRSAEAHSSLGLVKFQFDWDWKGAEQALSKAVELNPNYGTGHHFFADYLKGMGRFDEALAQIREAQVLDPLSTPINAGVGHVLYLSRRYDEAIVAYRHALAIDPNSVLARLWFGRPFLQKGMYAEAIAEIQQAVTISKESTITVAVLGHAYASAGQKVQALELLHKLEDRSKTQYVPSYWIALIFVGLNDADRAVDWLEKAFDEHSAWLAWVNVEPRFDFLRENPRFVELLKKIGF